MTQTDRLTERCDELRDALRNVRSRLEPAMNDEVTTGSNDLAMVIDADLTPDATPQLEQEIRQLEQALRDEGCEPE